MKPALLAAAIFAASAASAAAQSVQCGGVNDQPAIQAAIVAAETSAVMRAVHLQGNCTLSTAISATIGKPVSVSGDGAGATTLTFTGATNGFNITLTGNSAGWGGIELSHMAIVRGPTSPAQANTAVSITYTGGAGVEYAGSTKLNDLLIVGNNAATTGWLAPIYLGSLVDSTITDVQINGPAAGATDRGDAAIKLAGQSYAAGALAGVQYGLLNVNIVGYSCGVCITGYVQGVSIINSSLLANYDSLRWLGVSNGPNLATSAATAAGAALQFAPGSLSAVLAGQLVNGSGITRDSSVSSVNNATGVITLWPAPAAVASGTSVSFAAYQVAEALTVNGSTFSAQDRAIYCTYCSLNNVHDNSMIAFWPSGQSSHPTWTAIEFDESNNSVIAHNNILGPYSGTNNGIILNSPNSRWGAAANVVHGNIINGLQGGDCIGLLGTTSNTMVDGNNCYATPNGVVAPTAGNAIGANAVNNVMVYGGS